MTKKLGSNLEWDCRSDAEWCFHMDDHIYPQGATVINGEVASQISFVRMNTFLDDWRCAQVVPRQLRYNWPRDLLYRRHQ